MKQMVSVAQSRLGERDSQDSFFDEAPTSSIEVPFLRFG